MSWGIFSILGVLKPTDPLKRTCANTFKTSNPLYCFPCLFGSVLLALLFSNFPFYVSLAGGIVVCRLLAIKSSETSALETGFFIHIKQGFKGKMVLAIIGIMFFKNVVNNFDDLYIYIKSLIDLGIPLELLIVVSAAVICFPLASTQPGIAILFPIILPMAPDYHTKLLYGMFIYTSSFLFYYIFSPAYVSGPNT